MSAYVIAQVNVTDWDKFKTYIEETPRTIALFGGRYVARGGETAILEGDHPYPRMVIIEFPSLEKARQWYESEEYQAIKGLRAGAATGIITAVEGC